MPKSIKTKKNYNINYICKFYSNHMLHFNACLDKLQACLPYLKYKISGQ